jgi:NO-binding membrane sensor protein with MHYT domain/anti-sigma regulatory factor (Ser/Thr protein kinase)
MLRILYACIFEQHDLRLVALAAVVCVLACFSAINLFADAQEASGSRRGLLHATAATVFGAGVWTTHFIAELAYQPGIPIGYDINLTLASVALAVVVTWFGMWIALSFGGRHIGGVVVGIAIGAMHYTGIAALRAPADFAWDPVMVAISVVIGATMAAAAIEILGSKPSVAQRIGAAGMLVLAIVGLHFTAMAALSLTLDNTVATTIEGFSPNLLAITIAAVAALIITLGLACSFVDNARRTIEENERLQRCVEERTAELKEAQSELLRKERLSALGQVTATIAHELRNPLSAIRNTLYAVKETVAAQGVDLDRPISRAERSIARCDRIINDLLDYTRARKLHLAKLRLDPWIEEILGEQRLPSGIVMEHKLGADCSVVAIDAERMRRVLVNLIDNAAQAMLDETRERKVTVTTATAGDQFELVVEDTGCGIPPDVLPKVFEPLFSTKSFGTGLGLPVVKQIIEQHGGTIDITSEIGKGTCVVVRLKRLAENRIAIAA